MMKKMPVYAVSWIMALVCFQGSAAHGATETGTTVGTVTVVANGAGVWKVTATGTVSLGAGDKFTGFKVVFLDPNSNEVVPFISSFTQPDPGKTTNWSAWANVKGNWTASATITYTTNGTPGIASASKTFTVP